ncbi:phage tail protein [Sphingobium sp. SA916]|uniref:phage tail protein n=1 Tax=Sphingobium sp. SA916 TaxID=1851207 RepID=UPI00209BC47C|nr:phage tail protein [Sphingobium sp. SA916]
MALTFIVTNAGRAALVNAANTGTAPVTITQVGLTATAVTPTLATAALPGEFKRLATLSGDVVADDTIHLIVRDESGDVFTVRSLAMYLADGTLFGIYGQASVLIEKSAQAMMLLGIDVKFEDIAATTITFGNANFLNPPATSERMGVVELSTLAETIAGLDTSRVPAEKMVKDAVAAWLDARFGANNSGIWHPANDGAGSGLDADLLDGQQGSYYSNITARLGYTPVQQGTGNGQLAANVVKIGWSGTRLKGTVDVTDQGNFVFDNNLSGGALDINGAIVRRGSNHLFGPDNDGSGSGLDADLLDGQDGSYYSNITARLGYTPANRAGDTFTGNIAVPTIYAGQVALPNSGANQAIIYLHETGVSVVRTFGADRGVD